MVKKSADIFEGVTHRCCFVFSFFERFTVHHSLGGRGEHRTYKVLCFSVCVDAQRLITWLGNTYRRYTFGDAAVLPIDSGRRTGEADSKLAGRGLAARGVDRRAGDTELLNIA